MNLELSSTGAAGASNAEAAALWYATPHGAGSHGPQMVKEEHDVRILLRTLERTGMPVISKVYRTPRHLAWRSLFLPSRARREYRNLRYAHQRGVAVVQPLGWAESRRIGRPMFSQLTMEQMTGRELPRVMTDPGTPRSLRQSLAEDLGRLLADLHLAGVAWVTAYVRNVMVRDPDTAPSLVAFDFPYAWIAGRNLAGRGSAKTDLWWMLKTARSQCGFDPGLERSFFAGYCARTGLDPVALAEKIRRRRKSACFWNRVGVRILQAFGQGV